MEKTHLGRRLREPDVTGVASELARLERRRDGVTVADLAASGVDNVGPALHLAKHFSVEEVLRFGVKRAVDSDNVADLDHVLDGLVVDKVELLLHGLGETVAVRVVKLAAERVHAAKHGKADAARGNSADVHAFNVVSTLDAIGNVPAWGSQSGITRNPKSCELQRGTQQHNAQRLADPKLGSGPSPYDRTEQNTGEHTRKLETKSKPNTQIKTTCATA